MAAPTTYDNRRARLETYFDRTAFADWARLTSTAPVSRIRATVRAGRDRMRATLLGWLPADLTNATLLDAGCGTGALAEAAAQRGAKVVGVDVSANLVGIARERIPAVLGIDFRAGDMLDESHGAFDHAVAMDSLIHYEAADIVRALVRLSPRVRRSILFTVAPRTNLLALMHAAGKLFPRKDRAPAIVPIRESKLRALIAAAPELAGWRVARTERVAAGFYISQAMELVAP